MSLAFAVMQSAVLVVFTMVACLKSVGALKTSEPVGSYTIGTMTIPIIDPTIDNDRLAAQVGKSFPGQAIPVKNGQDINWTSPFPVGRGATKRALQPNSALGYAQVYDISFTTEGSCWSRILIRDASTGKMLYDNPATTGMNPDPFRSVQPRNIQFGFIYHSWFSPLDIEVGCGKVSYVIEVQEREFVFGHDWDKKAEWKTAASEATDKGWRELELELLLRGY